MATFLLRLNPKYFHSVYDVSKYALLIEIPPSDGDVKHDEPSGDFSIRVG